MNIFQDIEFKPLKNYCDSLFELHAKGIGADQKEMPALSSDEEDKLWEKGVISIDSFILVDIFDYTSFTCFVGSIIVN